MPNNALGGYVNGPKVDANELSINHGYRKFYCCTSGCSAEMILCKPGTGEAYFKSKHRRDHISPECIKSSIKFNPDKYDESLFDLDFAFESMLGLKHTNNRINRGNTGTRQGKVGNNRKLRMCTLPNIYAMCILKAKTDNYNGFIIDDMYADTENFSRYSNGIQGFKIVETSFYYYNDNENSFMLNYPINNRGISSWVKIIFEDKDLYFEQKRKMYGSMHIEPFIVAGDWRLSPNGSKHHSECIIHKRRQICYVEIQ